MILVSCHVIVVRFQCQVGAVTGVAGVQSTTAMLTVQVKPQDPVITNGDTLEIMEDSEEEIKCKSMRGKPPATIKWYDAANTEITLDEEKKNIVEETESIDNSKVQNQVSQIYKYTYMRRTQIK